MTAEQFSYVTAGLYWCLIVCWLAILIFYWREYRRLTALSPMIGTMLVVVFMDGARTLLESAYFGTWYTARTGLIPLDGANRLLLMVNDLLDISKMEAGQMTLRRERFSLDEAMAEAVSLVDVLGREKRLTLRRESRLPAGSHLVEGDRDKTRRVLVNLLGNAIKFAPEGSSVILKAEPGDDGMLCVSVVNTGPGIALEHQARIFDKFYQVESGAAGGPASTGLGLAFCKLALEAQGGRIGVESAIGSGSRFWFTLPAATPTPAPGR